VAHELNNALTAILGLAEILQRRSDLDADVRQQVDAIARHGTRLKRLGAMLIDISRGRRGDDAELSDLDARLAPEPTLAGGVSAPEPRPHRPRVSGTVLLVEDEEVVRAVLSWQLRDMGLHVEPSGSAEEAEEVLARSAGFDLAIVDHVLPGMTGLEFAARLRHRSPSLPVLMLSGRTESPETAAGVFAAWLVKPVDPDELRRAVAEQLGSHWD
jgi:CheY-like chemotaxis protein